MKYHASGTFDCLHCKGTHPRTLEECPETGHKLDLVHKMGGKILEGKYRVREILGEGGMGVIYRCEHRSIGHSIAIKFLSPEGTSSKESYERFLQEARLAASIDHPGIIKVFHLGITQGGYPYIVMELLEGQDLASRLDTAGRLEVGEAVKVTVQILEALHAVHAAGVVHRDLKPENIFLARQSGGEIIVKIFDFGVCRLIETSDIENRLTGAGQVYGTPYYVSPETVQSGMKVDHRADLYTVGVLLFEMLVGALPFDSNSMARLLVDIIKKPPPDPLELIPDLPPALGRVILRSLEKQPEDRFQSAALMLQALREAVEVSPDAIPDASHLGRRPSSASMYSIVKKTTGDR